ncbi:MAG TPA: TIGR03118 family protein [Candidatus Eisenbacteria bacterium]|nr:TIGR03118 family protein [Candidatus Eisenbacteria bacterium]
MKFRSYSLLALGVALSLTPTPGAAQHYVQKNLVSDTVQPPNSDGSPVIVDPLLRNPWGATRSASSPWWISNNATGTSTLYDGNGSPIQIFVEADGTKNDFVTVPTSPLIPAGSTSNPTGIVFNGSSTDFLLNKGTPAGKPAVFIFVGEDGTITGWNPQVNLLPGGNPPSPNVVLEVDNSKGGAPNGAVYKGAAIALWNGRRFLYAANFRRGRIEVYDTNFNFVHLPDDAFQPKDDREGDHDDDHERIPLGFAPFNVQNIGGNLFVTYARQDAERHDDVPGAGFGFVEIYSPAGRHIGHLEHGPWMNSPWGVVRTPRDFGRFSNSILVGNFGSGWIAAFNGFTYKFEGFLKNSDDSLVTIEGLWSLTFGNGGTAGPSTTLFFTAGTNGENDGLFGSLTPVAAENDESVE